jgi:hypothetical protein
VAVLLVVRVLDAAVAPPRLALPDVVEERVVDVRRVDLRAARGAAPVTYISEWWSEAIRVCHATTTAD